MSCKEREKQKQRPDIEALFQEMHWIFEKIVLC